MANMPAFEGGYGEGTVKASGDGTPENPWIPESSVSVGSGGGPATIADGADVAEGATADAAVAAGAAGTISAKLRRLTTDINALLTAAIPAGTNLIGKVGLDQTTPGTTNAVAPISGQAGVAGGTGVAGATVQRVVLATDTTVPNVTGNAASAATDSGNPVKVGGRYNATLPTLTDGQRGDLQVDNRSQGLVNLGVRLDETNDAIRAVTEGYKASYSASATALAPAASGTDIFEVKGSATKTVRVTRVQVTGVATAAGTYDVQLVKRSVANTGGTSTAPTAVPHDSADAAATAALKAYTANPTLGAAVGTMRSQKATVGTAATSAVPCVPVVFEFGKDNVRACVLRGVAESICVNLNGVTITGGLIDVDVTFTEE